MENIEAGEVKVEAAGVPTVPAPAEKSIRHRILFMMPYPGYLRMYESTVQQLARRSHRIYLAYDNPEKRADVPLLPPGSAKRIVFGGEIPWKPGPWGPLLRRLRSGIDYLRYWDLRYRHSPYLRRRMEKYLTPDLQFLTRFRGLHTIWVKALLQ